MDGTPFGRYRLIELLGRGGMGEVWKAFDTATQRVVAVKVLPAQLAADPMFEQRFRREAFAAAGLNDPHVVPIHNFGEIEGRLYVDMRLIEGEDLEHLLANGPLEPARAVKIIEQIASALNAAHRVGLVHRDVKPSNILVAEDDFAYLIDFGIARGAGETGLTGTCNVIGTWPYMAPERFSTGRSDTRSDIYALACVLYECLTAHRPFPGDSVEQQIAGHLTTPPPRPSVDRPGVSPQLDTVIATGMAKDPDDRYDTTTEMARAARTAITAPIPVRSPPRDQQRTLAAVAPLEPTQASMPETISAAAIPTKAGVPDIAAQAWAPTKARPAGSTPDVEPTDVSTSSTPEPAPWWRRTPFVLTTALTLIVAAVLTIVVVLSGGETREKGPLDGTFAVEFGPQTNPDGTPYENAPGGRETWMIESACNGGNCVATASKLSGSMSTTSTMVLDKISGRWLSVTAAPGTCQDAPTELWESMSLQERADGTLVGELIVRSTTQCARNQQVTFTRRSDVQANVTIADPKTQPPRVPSPASALRGQYRETDKYTNGQSAEGSFNITAYCLRTGERCLSFWQNPEQIKTLIFSGNRWVLSTTSSDSKCQAGGAAHKQVSLEYPLPQPEQDPITVLTGRGHYTVTGDCPFDADFDSRVERTGD